MDKKFLIVVNFESKKYNESGTLTYITEVKTENEARIKALEKINKKLIKDKSYSYNINLIMNIDLLPRL